MLFVAAAGNGNILGQGINLDREPFYPASYDLDNIISGGGHRARTTNWPGSATSARRRWIWPRRAIGVLSTLPGGRYGTANGTSMAAPHVAGAAALIWSEIPDATLAEVRQAILGGVDPLAELTRPDRHGRPPERPQALDSDAFAPRATLVSAPNITTAGGSGQPDHRALHDRKGIDATSLGDGDLSVTRQWGPKDPLSATLVPGSVTVVRRGPR